MRKSEPDDIEIFQCLDTLLQHGLLRELEAAESLLVDRRKASPRQVLQSFDFAVSVCKDDRTETGKHLVVVTGLESGDTGCTMS